MRLIVTLCFFAFLLGCSKEPEKPVFLGDRLLATAEVGADGKYYVPRLEGVQAQLKECQFKEFSDNYYQSECSFENAAPGRQRKPEVLRIFLTSPRVGVSAIDIEQTQMDFEDGLSIFAKLKDVQIEQLSCPDIEIDNSASYNTMFYRIKRDGKPIGVYREVFNSGSGGSDRTTTLYLGMSDAPCQWAGQNDKNLRKAVSNGAVSYADPTIPNSAGSSLNEADIKFNQDGKLDKNILYTVKGVPIFGCDGNISDQFRSAMYKAVAMVATENGMRLPNESLCTVAAFKIDGTTTFDIRFWTSSAEMDSCYRNNRCEFNTITNLFVAGSRATVTVTNVPPNKQVNACIDLKTKVHKKGFCD